MQHSLREETSIMRLIDTGFTLAERELLEQALGADQNVLWYGRPVGALRIGVHASGMIVGAIFGIGMWHLGCTVWSGAGEGVGVSRIILTCFMLPFVIASISMLLSPWIARRRRRRTAYVLTRSHALVLVPERFGRMKLSSYEVRPDMVLRREVLKDGSGSLVFDCTEVQGKNGTHRVEYGFLEVPDVQRVEALLEELMLGRSMPESSSLSDEKIAEEPEKSGLGWISMSVFTLVGTALLVFSAWLAFSCYTKAKTGERVEGVVVAMDYYHRNSRRSNEAPVFLFTDHEGKEHRIRHNVSSNLPLWEIGEKVPLIYVPERSHPVIVDTFFGKYGFAFFVALFGVIIGGLGVGAICSSLSGKYRRRAGNAGA